LLGGLGQGPIDGPSLLGASGHRGNQERDIELPAEKREPGIDRAQIELWEGVMFEPQSLQPGGQTGPHILFKVYPNVVRFALGRNFGHFGVLNGEIISAG
jgi:hypothetical protein